MTPVKADLGTKRICPSCSVRFYDLQKRPIECPKCAFVFEPESLYKQRRPRPAEPEKVVEHGGHAEERGEREDPETADAGSGASGDAAEASEGDDEHIDAEEEDAAEGTGMSVVDPAAEGAEMEDIEDDEIAEDDVEDPALLEEVGEDEEDVSGIIDTDLEKDER